MTAKANICKQDRMDCLSDIFERTSPRKRGPQARSSRLAFLDEVTDEQMRSYTAAQLNWILTQRAQVSQVLIQSYFWVLADFTKGLGKGHNAGF
jgi:hypothetical protein